MSLAERLVLWNRWYDHISEEWRFQFVVWSLLILGAINMLLTVSIGFPFALLVVLGIIAITAIRLPYAVGWVVPPENESADPRLQIAGAGWLLNVNRRYEAIPERQRFWVYPAVLLIAGGLNMMLTIAYGFPFGLLFLLALLFLVVIRAPFTSGWLPEPAIQHTMMESEPTDRVLSHDHAPPLESSPEPAKAPPGIDEPDHRSPEGPHDPPHEE